MVQEVNMSRDEAIKTYNKYMSTIESMGWELEIQSLEANIKLAELEERKAAERTAELSYTKANLQRERLTNHIKQLQSQSDIIKKALDNQSEEAVSEKRD